MKTIAQEVMEYALDRGLLVSNVREFWSERAAIREYDANTGRRVAETNAFDIDVKRRWP